MAARKRVTDEGIAAELISLLDQVTTDGKLSDEEVFQIRQWLEDNTDLQIPGIEFLRTCLAQALEDRVITEGERSEIHKAVERVLPIELRRAARERRTAAVAMEKASAREEKASKAEAEREAKRKSRTTGSANFMVAGCTHEGRAEIIEDSAEVEARVILQRQPLNRHDRNAIQVLLSDGQQIGYVPAEIAEDLAPKLDRGDRQQARITKILEGRRTPIPVIQAYLYAADTTVEGTYLQSDISTDLESQSSKANVQARNGCGCTTAALAVAILVALVTAMISA